MIRAGIAGLRYSRISAFTWLLVFLPLAFVFFVSGLFGIGAVVIAAGILSTLLVGKQKSQYVDALPLVFSVIGGVLVLFIVLPILHLLITTPTSKVAKMAADSAVQNALFLTLSAAAIATIISLLLGIPLGFVLAREQFAGKAVVEGIVDMPVVIPHTIAGIALLFIFGRSGVLGAPLNSNFHIAFADSYWGIVLAMLFVGIPFVINYARDGFQKVDPRMEYVARSLGASYMGAFFRITIPLTWRALLSGAIMIWARAVSEFGSIAVIAYYPRTINTLLFEWYNFFGYEYTKPLAALLLLVALSIFIALRAATKLTRAEHDQT